MIKILKNPENIKQRILLGGIFEINNELYTAKKDINKNIHTVNKINGKFYGYIILNNENAIFIRTYLGKQIKRNVKYDEILVFQ